MSTPSDPGSGQPDPWAVPPTDPAGQGAAPPPGPPPAYPPAPPPAYPPAPPPAPDYGQPHSPAMASRSRDTVNRRTAVRSRDTDRRRQRDTANPVTATSQWRRPTATRAGASASARDLLDFAVPGIIAVICFRISIAIGVILYLVALVWMFYNVFQGGKSGSRWGQKIVGIRMLKETTGQPMGGGLAIGRLFVHILDGIPCYIGYLWPLWDSKKQTFADKIMGTVVVNG